MVLLEISTASGGVLRSGQAVGGGVLERAAHEAGGVERRWCGAAAHVQAHAGEVAQVEAAAAQRQRQVRPAVGPQTKVRAASAPRASPSASVRNQGCSWSSVPGLKTSSPSVWRWRRLRRPARQRQGRCRPAAGEGEAHAGAPLVTAVRSIDLLAPCATVNPGPASKFATTSVEARRLRVNGGSGVVAPAALDGGDVERVAHGETPAGQHAGQHEAALGDRSWSTRRRRSRARLRRDDRRQTSRTVPDTVTGARPLRLRTM